mmetsp:Transcript_10120/g.29970  ORF Transcript_10120/g.29970 Transcript_10120/m.29970 type:complete len:236 (-) Transcript_10120:1458-2165(-)
MFSKAARSRRYHEPSMISGALRLKSTYASPAACSVQGIMFRLTSLKAPGMSFSSGFSVFGLSPIQTTRWLGLVLLPLCMPIGRGPSGLMAATLWSVKRRLSHSDFSLSRSSSSFLFCASCSCATTTFCFSSLCSSVLVRSSSWSVGKMSTTCRLSDGSAAREKASEMASSPTLYRTVSRANLLARTNFVTFSITAIIFFWFADSAWTQRAMLNPMMRPPQAAKRGGLISIGCETP